MGGKRWRFTSTTKGIIGRCYRLGIGVYVNFIGEDEYNQRMVSEFGFTKDEVAKHTKEARSYYAYPILMNNDVIGILYLFSTEPQVFPRTISQEKIQNAANQIIELLEVANIL